MECKAKRWGYYQSEFQFHFQRSGKPYLISRTIKAFIGDKELFDNLMPKTEYKKREYKPVVVGDNEKYISAGKIPELESSVSKYVRPLNMYFVPDRVRQVVYAPASSRDMPLKDQFIQEFLPTDYAPLGSYSQHFSHLLWAEEAQLEIDVKQFSMFGVDVHRQSGGRSFVIKVPGLAEGRPSILIGDSILVKPSGSTYARAFEGRAVDMRLDEVVLKFAEKFKESYIPGSKYDIQFRYNRNPWRRMQLAIATSNELLTGFDTVYRSKEAEKVSQKSEEGLRLANTFTWNPFNRMLMDNPEQKRAVSIILNDLFMPFPFLIHGPPGTGKTVTIVEAIKQIFHTKPNTRILVCAPSNSAADLLLDRLAQNLTTRDIFRLNAISRSQPMDARLEKFTYINKRSANKYDIPEVRELLKYRIIVTTCCTSAVLSGVGIPAGFFTHVFIDEGGQALEPEAMIPLNTFDHPQSTRFIIAGDHKQLGPIIHSNVARKLGLGISLLERLMAYCQWDRPSYSYRVFKMHNPRKGKSDFERFSSGTSLYCVKLLKNYRSHESIIEIPNELFYKSELEPVGNRMVLTSFEGWSMLPNKSIPVMFMHTIGKDMRDGDSPSWFNITEIQQVTRVIEAVKERKGSQSVTNDQIGVITPYNKQADSIRKVLKTKFEGVNVGTVETFQGQERMVIIISTVRSNPEYMEHDSRYNLGFLNDPKRFNVAITRAKALLVVIGNGNILCQDPSWRRWIEYCRENGCISGFDSELKENLQKDLPEQIEDLESDEEGLEAEEAGWREME